MVFLVLVLFNLNVSPSPHDYFLLPPWSTYDQVCLTMLFVPRGALTFPCLIHFCPCRGLPCVDLVSSILAPQVSQKSIPDFACDKLATPHFSGPPAHLFSEGSPWLPPTSQQRLRQRALSLNKFLQCAY